MPSDEQKRHWAKEYGTLHGSLVTNKNRDELAYVTGGVELIDPDTIRSPSNIWA